MSHSCQEAHAAPKLEPVGALLGGVPSGDTQKRLVHSSPLRVAPLKTKPPERIEGKQRPEAIPRRAFKPMEALRPSDPLPMLLRWLGLLLLPTIAFSQLFPYGGGCGGGGCGAPSACSGGSCGASPLPLPCSGGGCGGGLSPCGAGGCGAAPTLLTPGGCSGGSCGAPLPFGPPACSGGSCGGFPSAFPPAPCNCPRAPPCPAPPPCPPQLPQFCPPPPICPPPPPPVICPPPPPLPIPTCPPRPPCPPPVTYPAPAPCSGGCGGGVGGAVGGCGGPAAFPLAPGPGAPLLVPGGGGCGGGGCGARGYPPLPAQNDCCCNCRSPCRFKRRRFAAALGVRSLRDQDASCNSETLRRIIQENASEDVSESKRKIQKAAQEALETRIDVICGRGEFSYVVHTDTFCQETVDDITCYAFKPL
ncbi:hypothetical protein QR680_016970 [Steinernema hermaphroditum]|uniref:Ground-like domain-containing protein n=1 Tax=Steinernema hermaphroditum TaxID=289476 RepID=A0AA39HCW1_9BILA|nr:hypothetical protein QR680_016970 [Steinernema hermaphroditum]